MKEKKFPYEIWITGKHGFSQYFSTNEELVNEDQICEFAISNNLIDGKDIKYFFGYAQDVSDDPTKVKFAEENFVESKN